VKARFVDGILMRVIAVDWSGASSVVQQRTKIWLAEARDERLTRLETGRTRDEVGEYLVREAKRDPQLIVGLDFAFSFPVWFLRELGFRSPRELWAALAREDAVVWLRRHEPPFWGRAGSRRPEVPSHFRHADLAVPAVTGIRPKSVFQVSAPGTVGVGSLRGMPLLHRLAEAGFSIWPFDRPAWPQVVEIYPRLLTGPVKKTNHVERLRYLTIEHPAWGEALRSCPAANGTALDAAAAGDDAFDAAVSVLVMARHLAGPIPPPSWMQDDALLEGAIWDPCPVR
jgi:hypothetical protein